MAIKVTISPASADAVVTGEFTKQSMVDGVLEDPGSVSSATASDPVKEHVFTLEDGEILKVEAKPSVKMAYDQDQKANLPVPPEEGAAAAAASKKKAEPTVQMHPTTASAPGSHSTTKK